MARCSSARTSFATWKRRSLRNEVRRRLPFRQTTAARPERETGRQTKARQSREAAVAMVAENITVQDLLEGLPSRVHAVYERFARETPDHPAFVEAGRAWSYRQFSEAVEAVVDDLRELQVRPGDRVMVASENSVALGAILFAIGKLDAWAIAVNPRLSARELEQIRIPQRRSPRAVQRGAIEGGCRSCRARRRGHTRGWPVQRHRRRTVERRNGGRAGRDGRRAPGRGADVHVGHHRRAEGGDAEPSQPAGRREEPPACCATPVPPTGSMACCRCRTSSAIRSC